MNGGTVPVVEFQTIAKRLSVYWDPWERNAHHVLIGPTGSGKSHLIRYGILPVVDRARIVVIDSKGSRPGSRDDTWSDFAPVSALGAGFGATREGGGDYGLRFRLLLDPRDAKRQARAALSVVLGEGHTILVIDETRSLSDPNMVGVGKELERLIYEGRSSGVTVILGAQDPAWLPAAVKSQSGVTWLARQTNRKIATTLAEWTPAGRALTSTITDLRDREWLYTDSWGSSFVIGRTVAPNRE